MELPLLKEIVIILGLSVLIILAFQRFRMPAILGFLITGVVAGPHGFSLVKASHEVELLSEIGIIFLLFVIGIEFSLKGLARIRNTVLIGGSLQVGGTILFTVIIGLLSGLELEKAVFLGFLISLSSTAIVLKILQEKGQIATAHGRIAMGILIFQDIIVVPMILFTPILAGNGGNTLVTVLLLFAKVALVVGALVLLARYVVPKVLHKVVRTKSRELFILTIIVLIFATAWLTSSVGLSLALGAFFAGLIISESEYSHQATVNILPFREIFISFFFVSVGMLLNISYFLEHFWQLILLTIGVILLKMIVIAITVLVKKYPLKTVFLSAFTLFQVGEFAFLLSIIGIKNALLDDSLYQAFLSVSILSMGITPFMMGYSEKLSDWAIKAMLPERVRKRLDRLQKLKHKADPYTVENMHDHLVIIGFGVNGQNVAKAARQAKIPYIIIEFDPLVYQEAKKEGLPVVFGDASDPILLSHVHVHEARVVVIAISDAEATKMIIRNIREVSETTHIIVRTRYVNEIAPTLDLGADEVIPEEFETSIEIFTRVLNRYLVPFEQIKEFAAVIRSHNYELLAKTNSDFTVPESLRLQIPELVFASLPVYQDHNKVVGKSIRDSGLRSNFQVTVLAIRRGNKYITEIDPEMNIETDDMLYVFGKPDNIAKLNKYFSVS
jgi:monovalent cation:H+ antiporter-2, CPA2 family